MKKVANIHYQSRIFKIGWYPGASDSAIRETIRETLQIPAEIKYVLTDETNSIIAISPGLPDGISLKVEIRSNENKSNDNHKDDPSKATSNTFRGELLKFERINAHLANERTWLAWVRTALSTLSCAFAFLSLSTQGFFETAVYILGSLFCVAMIFIFITGWHRYSRIKIILGLSFNDM